MEGKLDLTGHFSPKYTLPEPVASAEAARDIDQLGLIGEAALKDKGFFTRMVVEDRSTSRKIMNPSNVRVLVVDDDESTALLIQKALARFQGNVSAAAKTLGLSRSALYRRLQRHGL